MVQASLSRRCVESKSVIIMRKIKCNAHVHTVFGVGALRMNYIKRHTILMWVLTLKILVEMHVEFLVLQVLFDKCYIQGGNYCNYFRNKNVSNFL